MVKLFIIATLLLIGILVYFAYKYKGETGYEETLKAMCKMFVAYLILSALMIVYKAEIRNFFRGEEKVTIEQRGELKKEKRYESSYVEGYLKGGSAWYHGEGKVYYNPDKVKVEIWNRQLVASDGSKLTQIFFLEGIWAGIWGYTLEEFLIREE